MHRITRDNVIRNVEFFQQFLHRRISLDFSSISICAKTSAVPGSERAEHLFRVCR